MVILNDRIRGVKFSVQSNFRTGHLLRFHSGSAGFRVSGKRQRGNLPALSAVSSYTELKKHAASGETEEWEGTGSKL